MDNQLMVKAFTGATVSGPVIHLNPLLTKDEFNQVFRQINNDLLGCNIRHNRIVGMMFGTSPYTTAIRFLQPKGLSTSLMNLSRKIQMIVPYECGGTDPQTSMLFGEADKDYLAGEYTPEMWEDFVYWEGHNDRFSAISASSYIVEHTPGHQVSQNNLVFHRGTPRDTSLPLPAPHFLVADDIILRDTVGDYDAPLTDFGDTFNWTFIYARGYGKRKAYELEKLFKKKGKRLVEDILYSDVQWDLTQFAYLVKSNDSILIQKNCEYAIDPAIFLQILIDHVMEVYGDGEENGSTVPRDFRGSTREVRLG